MYNIKIKSKTELDAVKSILVNKGANDLAYITSIFVTQTEALVRSSFEKWLGECISSCRAYLDEDFAEKQVASILKLPNYVSVYFEKEAFSDQMLKDYDYYEFDKASNILLNSEVLTYFSGNKPCLDLCYTCRVFFDQSPNNKCRSIRLLIC